MSVTRRQVYEELISVFFGTNHELCISGNLEGNIAVDLPYSPPDSAIADSFRFISTESIEYFVNEPWEVQNDKIYSLLETELARRIMDNIILTDTKDTYNGGDYGKE